MPFRSHFRVVLPLVGIGALAVSQAAFASVRQHAPVVNRVALPPAFMTRAAVDPKTAVLYWSDAATDAVYLVNANNLAGPLLGKIADGTHAPGALAIDTKGVLYVATANKVMLYKPGSLHPFRAITDPEGAPGVVAVGADGTLAVTFGGGIFKNGVLDIFDKGSPTPTRRIPLSLHGEAALLISGVSVDSSENVYLSLHHYPDGPAGLFKFAPGSTRAIKLNLLPGTLGGLDAKGNVYIAAVSVILEYAPGARTLLRTITNGLASVPSFTVNPDGSLFVPNTAHFSNGIPTNGNLVTFAANGSTPVATRQANDDTNPQATALRQAAP